MPSTNFHWSATFTDLGHFARFCAAFPFEVGVAGMAGRGAVAAFFTKEVKARFGDKAKLQPPLADSTVRERTRLGWSPDDPLLRSGTYRDSNSWGHVTPELTVVGSTDRIAPFHELGGKVQGKPPKRSTLAATASEKNIEGFELFCKIFSLECQHFGERAVRGQL